MCMTMCLRKVVKVVKVVESDACEEEVMDG